jgi:enhancer of mRNA-decapping protein 3
MDVLMMCSIGEPSVIDPTTALSLQISTNHIVCIGAPRIGLLRALQKTLLAKASSAAGGSATTSSTPSAQFSPELLNAQIWVVDIGVEKAWKRSGLAGSRGVKFGADWVVPVKLVEGLAEEGR